MVQLLSETIYGILFPTVLHVVDDKLLWNVYTKNLITQMPLKVKIVSNFRFIRI